MTLYKKSLFIFRRDLRLSDNTGLIAASQSSSEVIPIFIIDNSIMNSEKFSEFRLQFLKDCLEDLDSQLNDKKSHLHIFVGATNEIISKIIKTVEIDAIFVNTDYTPFSKNRDKKIQKICKNNNIDFIEADDILLHNVDMLKTGNGEPYKVFTAFYSKAKEFQYRMPQKCKFENMADERINFEKNLDEISQFRIKNNPNVREGGRKACLKLIKNLKNLKNYDEERNIPSINGTSLLSAHNKFGTCSIREIHEECIKNLGQSHTIISELHWRDFFTYIMHHSPYSYSKEFNKKFQKIPWSTNEKSFSKWCKGETGFPIVDAGMRELNNSGFMHNRVRMIVASFLTKDLHIDWRMGEKYFATKLIDYDPCVNIGNWQWAASTGCDAQPWFRIFNPWLQQKRFDPECKYIKKWIPELGKLDVRTIHDLWKKYPENISYPKPILDHSMESKLAKEIFSSQ
jgi:deoxyribodipyrimidine photo-lyase